MTTQDRPSQPVDEYELDTARAKTPAERLRILADMMDSGGKVFSVGVDDSLSDLYDTVDCYAPWGHRLITKRRPALVIPALEVFEGPLSEVPAQGTMYYAPDPTQSVGFWKYAWHGLPTDDARLDTGLAFHTPEAAARIGLHIRAALAKAVAK